MKSIKLLYLLFAFCLAFGTSTVHAQNDQKVKITVKKNKNGKSETIKKEFEGNNEELQNFLKEMGIDIDINNSKNDVVEIIIDKNEIDQERIEELTNNILEDLLGSTAFLGIRMQDNDGNGVHITSIIDDSPAEEIALQKDDVLLSINGVAVNSTDDATEQITSYKAGEEVKLVVERDGKKKNFKATLADRDTDFFQYFSGGTEAPIFNWNSGPHGHARIECHKGSKGLRADEEKAFLGVVGTDSNDIEGALIEEVTPGSTAEIIGLKAGDIVTSFNGEGVSSFDGLAESISKSKVGESISIEVNRGGEEYLLTGEIGSYTSLELEMEDIVTFENLGNLNFNFDCEELKLNSEELDESLEKLGEQLKQQLKGLENLEELENLDFDFNFEGFEPFTDNMTVIVFAESLTQEEIDQANENAEHKISIENSLELEEVNFFPNPSDGNFNLNFNTPYQGDLTVNIYDQNGRTVYKEMLAEFAGEYQNRIDISDRADGSYFLQIIQNNKSFNKKILKQ